MTMTFEPVNDLERQLMAAADDPSARAAFMHALLEQPLFVITEGPPPAVTRGETVSAGETIESRLIDIDGTQHQPIFTSPQRIASFVTTRVGTMGMAGRDLLTIVRGTPLVLNPGAAYGKLFTVMELDSILDGTIFQPKRSLDVGGKQILLGQPSVHPRHLLEPLRACFDRFAGDVTAAYLAHAFIPGTDGRPHTLIGIDTSGDYPAISAAAGAVITGLAKPDEIVDLLRLTDAPDDPVASYMRRTTPIYGIGRRKKWFGLF